MMRIFCAFQMCSNSTVIWFALSHYVVYLLCYNRFKIEEFTLAHEQELVLLCHVFF